MTSANVPAGGFAQILLPEDTRMVHEESVQPKGILVTADGDIAVYAVFDEACSCDGALILPAETLGKEYTVATYSAFLGDSRNDFRGVSSEFAVVAISDSTVLTITTRIDVGEHRAGQTYTVSLNAGDAYQLVSDSANDDFSGTTISSNRPVSVFGSSYMSRVPGFNVQAANYLLEQMLPNELAGTQFPLVPFGGRPIDEVRCMALYDGTIVLLDGVQVATLSAGEIYQWSMNRPAFLSTSSPSIVTQFAIGSTLFENDLGDPTMVLVPPSDRYVPQHLVVAPPEIGLVETHWINVIAPTTAIGSIQMDGEPLVGFFPIAGSQYSHLTRQVTPGSHFVESTTGVPIGVTVYGFGSFDAYSFAGGWKVDHHIASIEQLTIDPVSLYGSRSATGTVLLTGAVSDLDGDVQLSCSLPGVTVQPTLHIEPGYSSATFPVNTSAVTTQQVATISATFKGQTVQASLTIRPNEVETLTVAPNPIVGGNKGQGTASLALNAAASTVVHLTSSNPAVVTVPASVTIPLGARTAAFQVTTKNVANPVSVTISATVGPTTKQIVLQVVPVRLVGFTLSVPSAFEGGIVTGQVSLNGPAPSGGVVVKFANNNPAAATIPASVTIPAGTTAKSVSINCKAVTSTQQAIFTATHGQVSLPQTLIVAPIGIQSMFLSSSSATGGQTVSGSVTLAVRAPSGGIKVNLTSNNTAVATVPTTVTVPANSLSASFTVTTKPVGSTSFATITGKRYASVVTANLTVKPPELSTFTITPSSVKGGSKATGKVTLTGKAGPGGVTFYIQSNNSAATPPTTVVVPANQTTASFQISTSVVSLNTMVQVIARSSSVQKNAVLTVTK